MEIWNKNLNGVYRAINGSIYYLVKFIDGVSKQGLKHFDKEYSKISSIEYFRNSAFTSSIGGYKYEKATYEEEMWLNDCIEYDQFMPKRSFYKDEFLIFN